MKLKNRVPEIPEPPTPWSEAFPLPPPLTPDRGRVETEPSWLVFVFVCGVLGWVALVVVWLPLLAGHRQ